MTNILAIVLCTTTFQSYDCSLCSISELEGYHEGYQFDGSFTSAAISLDAKYIVAATGRKKVRVWDARSGKRIGAVDAREQEKSPVSSVCVDGMNRWIISCGPWMQLRNERDTYWEGGMLKVWDRETMMEIFRFSNEKILSCAFVPRDRKSILVFDTSCTLNIVSTETESHVKTGPTTSLRPAQDAKNKSFRGIGRDTGFSTDGNTALTTTLFEDGSEGLLLYDVSNRKVESVPLSKLLLGIGDQEFSSTPKGIRTVALSPDGKLAVLRFEKSSNTLYLFQVNDMKYLHKFKLNKLNEIDIIKIAPNGHTVAVCDISGRIVVYDLELKNAVLTHDLHATGRIKAMQATESEIAVMAGGENLSNARPDASEKSKGSSYSMIIKFQR